MYQAPPAMTSNRTPALLYAYWAMGGAVSGVLAGSFALSTPLVLLGLLYFTSPERWLEPRLAAKLGQKVGRQLTTPIYTSFFPGLATLLISGASSPGEWAVALLCLGAITFFSVRRMRYLAAWMAERRSWYARSLGAGIGSILLGIALSLFLRDQLSIREARFLGCVLTGVSFSALYGWALVRSWSQSYESRGRMSSKADQSDWQGVIAECDQLLQKNPDDAYAYHFRGYAWRELGQQERALADYGRALELDPRSATVYASRSRIYYDREQHDEALADVERALAIAPEASLYYHQGIIHYVRRDFERAIQSFDAALSLEPGAPKPLSERGWCYYKLGQLELARADLDRAIAADATSPRAYRRRAEIAMRDRRWQAAIDDLSRIVDLHHDLPGTLTLRGDCYVQLELWRAAIDDYSLAMKETPGDVALYLRRGVAYGRQGDLKGAIADHERALQLNARLPAAYSNLSFFSLQQGRLDEALRNADRAIELSAAYAPAFSNRGLVHAALGDAGRAEADFRQALSLDPPAEVRQEAEQGLRALGLEP